MTKKDYKKFAEMLKTLRTGYCHTIDNEVWISFKTLVFGMEDLLEADNPKFDKEKFEKAVGI